MKKTVAQLLLSGISLNRFRIRQSLLVPVCFAILCSLLAIPGTAQSSRGKQRPRSLDEINNRITSLQNRVDSLTGLQGKLRQDSSRLKQESAQESSAIKRKKAEVEDVIAKKKVTAGGIRSQYEKARQDSIGIISEIKGQMAELHKEIVKLESTIITLSNELEVLSQRRDQLDAPAAAADQKTIARLQAQIKKNDSIIKARQESFAQLSAQREKLRKDSLQEENKLNGARQDFHERIVSIDKNIAQIDAVIEQVKQKLASGKSDKQKKITESKASLASLTSQKRSNSDRKTATEAEIATLAAEKQKLQQSATTAQRRHKELRTPYEKALANAEQAHEAAVAEKKMIAAVREKLRLDSSISKARDALDQSIQAEAERKKGAKKLVEQREKELNELLNQLDGILQNTPGIKQKEASFHAPSASQKSGMVSDALTTADKPVATAAAKRDKAKKDLADFDAKNPAPADPAGPRMSTIDSLISLRKKEAIQLTAQIDSIAMIEQDLQTSLVSLTKSLGVGTDRGDSLMLAKNREKTALASNRTKLVKDSIQNENANAGALTRIRTELSAMGGRQITIQNDITTQTAERDKAKEALAAAQEKAGKTQVSQKAEKKKIDSLIAAKQQDITLISMKSEKLKQDSISLVRKEAQQIKMLNPPPSSFANQLSAAEKEIAVLQSQSDSLNRVLLAAEATPAEKSRALSTQITSLSRSINAAEKEIAVMEKEKKAAYERLKNDRGKYDSLIRTMEQDLAAAITKRDKARQDSAAAETGIRQASQKLQSDAKEQDDIVATRQKELDALAAQLTQAKEDSIKTAAKVSSALQSFSQSIKNIDGLISAKEKELADLNDRREKARQDSIAERKRQNGLLIAAHDDIIRKNAALSQKKADIVLAQSNKKKIQTDTVAYKLAAKQSLASATTEIQRQNALIEKRKNELSRLQQERDEIAAHVKSVSGRGGTVTVTEPKPAPTFSPSSAASAPPVKAATTTSPSPSVQAPTPVEIAQMRSEELYNMLGDNRVSEAAKRFRQLKGFLKANLDPEAFQMLKVTIEQMGGTVN
ncbi:MAG: hypothetical protein JXA71_17080 [Chitinispirillaceae bacterium]|nr:hypothetical protein [Chitinispirillaceae bacterium]